jgi:hypothetical protein
VVGRVGGAADTASARCPTRRLRDIVIGMTTTRMTAAVDTTTMTRYHDHLTAAIAYARIDDLRRDAAITARRRAATKQPRPRITRRRPTWWTAVTARAA